jgi:hypothetical protein
MEANDSPKKSLNMNPAFEVKTGGILGILLLAYIVK